VAPPPLPGAPTLSPVVLNDFGEAQGWGGADNPRILVPNLNGDGTSDYVGFGDEYTFVAYGGTFASGGETGPGFTTAVASVEDFGTDEGYTADVQRGAPNYDQMSAPLAAKIRRQASDPVAS